MPRLPLPIIPTREITAESVYRRRSVLRAMALAPVLAATGCGDEEELVAAATEELVDVAGTDPYRTKEAQTRWADATSYNNFYEFGTGKNDPGRNAHTLVTDPWSVQITGEAERTGTFRLEDVLRDVPVEDRVYRLRCVEGWSMVIPWRGVELGKVLKKFAPTSRAKYVAFTTLADPNQMPGVRYPVLQWPYVEGLRIDEAMHPLTLLATGMYGKELAKQNGAPLRLLVPWKYGFKSIKSIVRIAFTEQEPPTSWNRSQPDEYGFYSNVNPAVDHPRWSQRTERRLAGDTQSLFARRVPTLPFNGYADQVASLYSGMDLRKYF